MSHALVDINLFFAFSIASSQIYELKRTDSNYALYMKSDAYKNNMDKTVLATFNKETYPYGFYIGKLEFKSNTKSLAFGGILGIKITKKDAQIIEQKVSLGCTSMDLSSAGQGICLFCLNTYDYDSIEIFPQTGDTIAIEDYSKIQITDSVPNEDSMANFNEKYLLLILSLLLFI